MTKIEQGWLNIYKPEGMSSFQVVRQVRKALQTPKVGHGGTLDPLACGVLPIALGEATKTVPFLMNLSKTYVFDVTWGEQRTTDDREGDPIMTSDSRPSPDEVQSLLSDFYGPIRQVPPQFCALKKNGQRLYALAKKGIQVEIEPREVTIHSIKQLKNDTNRARFEVQCSKGTYVRSIARDMGKKLGCGGYVSYLERTQVGNFSGPNTISLDDLLKIRHKVFDTSAFCSIAKALADIPALRVRLEDAKRLRQGQRVLKTDQHHPSGFYLCIGPDDKAVGIIQWVDNVIKPYRMINE